MAELACAGGLARCCELRAWFQRELALGYGEVHTLAAYALKALAPQPQAPASLDEIVAGYYAGAKAGLRPIHGRVMAETGRLGALDIAPPKTCLALRRARQFAMLGPAANERVELGLNAKNLPESARLPAQPAGSLCKYTIRLAAPGQVDNELLAWLRAAYASAG